MQSPPSPDRDVVNSEYETEDRHRLWDYLYAVQRRWWVLALGLILGLSFGLWRQRGYVPVYAAESVIQRVDESRALTGVASLQSQPNMVSELELMRSSAVMGPVVDSLGLASSPVDRPAAIDNLRRSVSINQVPGTNLIRISYRSGDPEYTAAMVNAVARSYQRFSASRARDAARRAREFIATELADVADSLETAQQLLVEYQVNAGLLNPGAEGGQIESQLLEAENDLRTLRYQEGVLESLITGLEGADASDDAFRRIVIRGGDLVPTVQGLYGRWQEMENQRSRLTASRFGRTSRDPDVEVLDSLIVQTKNDIRAVTRESLSALQARLASSEARVAELRRRQGSIPRSAVEYSRLEQRAGAIQSTFDLLTARFYEAQIAEGVEAGKVEIVDAAVVPRSPLPRSTGRGLIVFFVLGGLAGLAGVFGLEYLDNRVFTARDAERAAGLTLLAGVPALGNAAGQDGGSGGVVMTNGSNTPAAESFRMLRTVLQYVRSEQPRVLAITSASPGEGKSLVSVNLALALAQQGTSVLLIDADLRRPKVHQLIRAPQAPGLSEILVGRSKLNVIRKCNDSLDVLCSGKTPPDPAELLSAPKFEQLVQEAREKYDMVVIDTPPVLAVADPTTVAQVVDGVILVVRAETADRGAVRHAAEQLRRVNAPLLGLVLNGVPANGVAGRTRSRFGYGYYGHTYTEYYGNGGSGNGKGRGLRDRIRSVFTSSG